jgi:hypothetical protein
MNGILLDPLTGTPVEADSYIRDAYDAGRLPASVLDHLARARAHPRGSGPNATKQGFYEILVADLGDGTQILNSSAEAIICPDYVFAGGDPHLYPGASFNIRCYFDVSNVITTPGTLTMRVRWGGVAGTILCTSAAITLSATARSNYSGTLDVDLVWRTIGSAATCFAMGVVTLNDVPVAADSAPQSLYTMTSAGANVPAVVTALDTTTAKNLSVTAQFSVSTATTQLTNHIRRLACLN